MINLISIFFSAAVVSLLLTFPLVWLLGQLKAGQPVREEGPASHRLKAGTPTMGGIGFILTILILGLIAINWEFSPQYLALMVLILAYALIGLADDLLKVFRKENLGLTFWQKIFLQVGAAAAFSIYLTFSGQNLNQAGLLANYGFHNPYLYQLLVIFVIVGSANATNLTDGLNGLLAGSGAIAFLAFGILALKLEMPEAALFSFIAAGALGAFLYFNFPKAKLFMGDIGSLAIGAGLAGLAVLMHKELRLIVIGGLFVVEALSVILQVSFYKLFKRRLFKMAPLHHHFEVMGFKEQPVVIALWIMGLILAVIGVLMA